MYSWKYLLFVAACLAMLLPSIDGCLGSGGGSSSGSSGGGSGGSGGNPSSKGNEIASKARSYIGSDKWQLNKYHSSLAGVGDNKCNIFVADVLKEVDADAPNRHWWYSPIGANEWANGSSSYLTKDKCWSRCYSFQKGDVIAENGHVGIVSGARRTTSAAYTASPRGTVVQNDWGFRSGQSPTCWRYTC